MGPTSASKWNCLGEVGGRTRGDEDGRLDEFDEGEEGERGEEDGVASLLLGEILGQHRREGREGMEGGDERGASRTRWA